MARLHAVVSPGHGGSTGRATLQSCFFFILGTLCLLSAAAAQTGPPPRESVAVIPFINISGQPGEDWIGAGIAETVVADLKGVATLSVIDPDVVRAMVRSLSPKLDDSSGSAVGLGRELKAAWIVTGAYQRLGDQVRITARMINVRTGEVTSTAKVDGRLADMFVLEDRIVTALGVVPPAAAPAQGQASAVRATVPAGPTPAAATTQTAARAPGGAGGPGARGPSAMGAAAVRAAAAPQAPAPVAPATVSRTPEGAITIRAVRLTGPIKIDGRLDDPIYADVPAIRDYIQQEPREGEPASELTDSWIFFDDKNLYVSARCWDSHPERDVSNEMRRDTAGIFQNENFTVMLDTFHDKRNGVFFVANMLGGLRDALVTDETDQNTDWNGVWDARTGTFDGGWTVEMIIPFKTLRYNAGPNQVWGVNLRRIVRWKNEFSHLVPLPAFLGTQAFNHVSFGATLVGLEVPDTSLNLELKPYGISGLRTDLNARPAFENDRNGDYGLDVKYGITKSLTMDLTYNTDFAQVEDDTQQVNLTRFNLQFPERREFFLEGRGTFAFGGAGTSTSGSSNVPLLFFSRRIGLNTKDLTGKTLAFPLVVPIVGGGRVTGKAGKYAIGLLNIQQDSDTAASARATNFTVLRLKRDILRRSNVGVIYTRRQETVSGGPDPGDTVGIDGLYSASQSLFVNGYVARTRTPGVHGKDSSYAVHLDYTTDRYGVTAEQLGVAPNFNPQVGFLRRTDFQRSFASARFSPRPARTHMKAIRRFYYQASGEYLTTNDWNRRDLTEAIGSVAIELQNSDKLTMTYTRDYEYIPKPFAIDTRTRTTVPVGGYNYQSGLISYLLGTQHGLSGTVSYQQGTLYDGTKRTLGMSSGRLKLSAHLAFEPSASINWVDIPWGTFRTMVVANRTTFAVTPRMFLSSLIQYSSSAHALSTNTRFRWEYTPGSELFVVYTDGRDTDITARNGLPQLTNRAFIVKMNKLFRF